MMRLDKYLAHCRLATRSEAKKKIRAGKVSVNGTVIKNTDYQVDENSDKIILEGQKTSYASHTYIMLNKPQGVITATKSDHKRTIFDCLDFKSEGLFPVGRLDKDTEGLLLITDDGELTHLLLSPKHHVDKTYYVETAGSLNENHLKKIEEGIWINDEEKCMPASVEIIDDHAIYLTIQEGKYHQVKRMMHACDTEVTFLKRIRIGSLILDESLSPGEYRTLSEAEIDELMKLKK